MKVSGIAIICLCGLATLVGCAKFEDDSPQAKSKSTTQPAVTDSGTADAQPASADFAPTASMLMINRAQQWFPPARLAVTSIDGKVVARLYTDDPKDVWKGKENVNCYDLQMVLSNIADPSDISKAVWVNQSSSMDRQDSPYGIFLDNQHDVLQPVNVMISFQGKSPRVQAIVQGKFALFHVTDQMPHPVPELVPVAGILDATVDAK
jgi:hypothetical protein